MVERKTHQRGWASKLKEWRQKHSDDYAKKLLATPAKVNLFSTLPFPGIILIMGMRRHGKTALACRAAHEAHERKGIAAALHLPGVPADLRRRIQTLLPEWFHVVTTRKEWPENAFILYDEASQSAHARRSASEEAVDLDNLISISGQRNQTIAFISHHSRKLDLNIVHEVDRILWKPPSYAHAMFERDELSDFTHRAYEFFDRIPKLSDKKRATLCLDFHTFEFTYFTNQLAPWWTEDLSRLFAFISMEMDKRERRK
jgi:hypothetical protein